MLCSIPLFLLSQNWIILGNDPSGDPISDDYTDLTEISYMVDDDLDSLWILLIADTTHFLFKPGFGIVMGLDTNMVVSDGTTNWGGANQSMKPDVQHTFVTNNAFPTLPPTGPGSKWISASKDSLILGFGKYELDANGHFNVIFGTGIWDLAPGGMVYDEAPDMDVYQINVVISADYSTIEEQGYIVFPNPANQYLNISGSDVFNIKVIKVVDASGKLMSKQFEQNFVDVSALAAGVYFLEIETDKGIQVEKIIKK